MKQTSVISEQTLYVYTYIVKLYTRKLLSADGGEKNIEKEGKKAKNMARQHIQKGNGSNKDIDYFILHTHTHAHKHCSPPCL